MDKIPTMYVRDDDNMKLVTCKITPGCEWVFDPTESVVATVKRDGMNVRVTLTACGVLLEKRRNPSREEKALGAEPGYVLADAKDPSDKYLFMALYGTKTGDWPNGVYPCEALGKKIQGGAECEEYRLYPFTYQPDVVPGYRPSCRQDIIDLLSIFPMEGIVFHHADGRMAKIKSRDFGITWPVKETEAPKE